MKKYSSIFLCLKDFNVTPKHVVCPNYVLTMEVTDVDNSSFSDSLTTKPLEGWWGSVWKTNYKIIGPAFCRKILKLDKGTRSLTNFYNLSLSFLWFDSLKHLPWTALYRQYFYIAIFLGVNQGLLSIVKVIILKLRPWTANESWLEIR